MFQSILLKGDQLDDYTNITPRCAEPNVIDNLDHINIFIGPNNSGKSRFIRGIIKNSDLKYKKSGFDLTELNTQIRKLKLQINTLLKEYRIASIANYNEQFIEEVPFFSLQNSQKIKNNISNINHLKSFKVIITDGSMTSPYSAEEVAMKIRSFAIEALNHINLSEEHVNNLYQERTSFIYVPTLRGLRGTNYGTSKQYSDYDNYQHRTHHDYFSSISTDYTNEYKIFTGLSLFEDAKKLLLGNNKDREKIRIFEQFIGDTFFNGKSFNIIPSIQDNAVHISIGGENDKPIYHLGDGIQSIIILTYPLFFNTGRRLKIFYEEPDLFLHPGFQRIFIETILLPKFNDFQFFFTTHSNHFLDMTLDYSKISVYSFLRTPEGNFTFENVENTNIDLLSNLGVRNSSVFLTNCTIWVEGITDRIYIRRLLELFLEDKSKQQFKEDVHYSFVEYGGNNITHWSFLDDEDERAKNINVDRLCSRLFLITDSDNAGNNENGQSSRKKQRQEKLRDKLKERYYCLEGREIENLLTGNVIAETIRSLEKEENKANVALKAGASFTREMYIGEFIETNITGHKRSYKADSGTIKNKVEFAKAAVAEIKTFADLNPEAEELTKRLYNFIEEHNAPKPIKAVIKSLA